MAPSHELREGVNDHIRERLAREGRIAGPILQTQRLVSKGYTGAEKALAANYAPGDVVAFHRPYKRLGVEKGEERRVEGVDRKNRTVHLEGPEGSTVAWKPSEIGGRQGGTEVYRTDTVELRAGDRIRWTRNDKGLGVVNSGTAEVLGVRNGRVSFLLEEGRKLTLTPGDPQLRHLDHAWASTVHAFQGRTVDTVIAAMEANHPQLTTAKAFYVEISRARDRAELVTDDAQALKERLEAVTGERPLGAGRHRRERPARARARTRERRKSVARQGTVGPGGNRVGAVGEEYRTGSVASEDAGTHPAHSRQARRDGYGSVNAVPRCGEPRHGDATSRSQRRLAGRDLDALDAERFLPGGCRKFFV